ncbi:MAG: hypothetical protein KAS71_14150, partial [Bacteroidales bacterium]|nr:hypothetical protein [Bacteroidales bacterium]
LVLAGIIVIFMIIGLGAKKTADNFLDDYGDEMEKAVEDYGKEMEKGLKDLAKEFEDAVEEMEEAEEEN